MRNILGIKSYMDTEIPSEINLTIEAQKRKEEMGLEQLEEYYFKLEEYCRLYMITEKWHKCKSKHKPVEVKILTSEEKKHLTAEQLEKYCVGLEKYYETTKKLENSKDRKIVRLSNQNEEQLTDDEYAIYLKQLRIYDDNSKVHNLSLRQRKMLAPLVHTLMKVSKLSEKIKIQKLNKKMPKIPEGRPIIYVLTHAGKDDQVVFSDVIKDHYTVLSGDYESLHNCIEGKVCALNGIEYFDMRSKKERAMIEERIEQKINEGDNILCSMEAAWNLSANVPVLELFPGMIRSAIKTNAVIMPVGIEMFDKKFFGINVGETYFDPLTYVGRFETEKEMLDAARADLRQLMADIKMQLYFDKRINKKITTTRDTIGDYEEYNEEFKKEILRGWTFTEEAVKKKAYNNKNKPENVFSYLIQKYSNLEEIYAMTNDESIPQDLRNQMLGKLEQLLVELSEDLKNPVYPNEIHNKLQQIFDNIVVVLNSKNLSTDNGEKEEAITK